MIITLLNLKLCLLLLSPSWSSLSTCWRSRIIIIHLHLHLYPPLVDLCDTWRWMVIGWLTLMLRCIRPAIKSLAAKVGRRWLPAIFQWHQHCMLPSSSLYVTNWSSRPLYHHNVTSVSTYKSVAEKIGSPRAFRAVGSSLRKNPFAPTVPCHRVVASDLSLGQSMPYLSMHWNELKWCSTVR